MMSRGREAIEVALESGFWKRSNARFLRSQVAPRAPSVQRDDAKRIDAAAHWLARAQDANLDGGVSYAFRLRHGWGLSYPETTGYIIPTWLALADSTGDPDYRARAERGVDFLSGLQLPEGAFPAGTLAAKERLPSIFNTGQIINGLTAWYVASADEHVRQEACAAADWLVSAQDDDGAWRRHGYLAYPVTYTAHVSCWLAELGSVLDEPRYGDAASRHTDWVLCQQDPETGWFNRSGFAAAEHEKRIAITHTIAYTIWGLLHGGIVLGRDDAVAAARRAAVSVAALACAQGRLPGMLDAAWRPRSSWECLTGNAQMALVWMRLADLEPDDRMERAARVCLDRVCTAQYLRDSNPGIRGGIPGSRPARGGYFPFEFPNWGSKFFVDALLARARRRAPTETGDPIPRGA